MKNEETGRWEKAPYYTVNDKMPLGHGEKSVLLIQSFMRLEPVEVYGIRWHMGAYEQGVAATLSDAIQAHPIVLAVHEADMYAAKFMESEKDNRAVFRDLPEGGDDEDSDQSELFNGVQFEGVYGADDE